MNKDPKPETKPSVSSALSDFLKAAAPKAGQGPLDEMTSRFSQKREDDMMSRIGDPTFYFTGSNHFEWMVEAQIRQWNMAQKARKQAIDPKNKPPASGQ